MQNKKDVVQEGNAQKISQSKFYSQNKLSYSHASDFGVI